MTNANDDFWLSNAAKLRAAVEHQGAEFAAVATDEELHGAAGSEFVGCSDVVFSSIAAVMRSHHIGQPAKEKA